MNIDRFPNASKLDIDPVRPDIRRDLHVFARYVQDREVKRGHRDNSLSKADARRLAKLCSDPQAESDILQNGDSAWVDFVDGLAHQLGLVHYDTEGIYAGYTSSSPSYPDNYIQFDAKAYDDLYVQSELYPARLLRDVAPLCELVSEDTTTVFRLDRQKLAAACAADAKLDVIRLLESLCNEPLPANVRRELSDWSAHSDKFVLYSGCSLLETDGQPANIERFRVENIAPGMDLVRSADQVFTELEKQELAPLRIKHGDKSLAPLPAKTRSAFPRTAAAVKKRREAKTKVTLMRVTRVQLLCPDREFLDRLQRLLADVNCPVEADRRSLSLAYSNQHEKEVSRAISTLKKEFEVTIDDQ